MADGTNPSVNLSTILNNCMEKNERAFPRHWNLKVTNGTCKFSSSGMREDGKRYGRVIHDVKATIELSMDGLNLNSPMVYLQTLLFRDYVSRVLQDDDKVKAAIKKRYQNAKRAIDPRFITISTHALISPSDVRNNPKNKARLAKLQAVCDLMRKNRWRRDLTIDHLLWNSFGIHQNSAGFRNILRGDHDEMRRLFDENDRSAFVEGFVDPENTDFKTGTIAFSDDLSNPDFKSLYPLRIKIKKHEFTFRGEMEVEYHMEVEYQTKSGPQTVKKLFNTYTYSDARSYAFESFSLEGEDERMESAKEIREKVLGDWRKHITTNHSFGEFKDALLASARRHADEFLEDAKTFATNDRSERERQFHERRDKSRAIAAAFEEQYMHLVWGPQGARTVRDAMVIHTDRDTLPTPMKTTFDCPICLESYDKSKATYCMNSLCLHTICEECAAKGYQTTCKPCPECRTPCTARVDWLGKIMSWNALGADSVDDINETQRDCELRVKHASDGSDDDVLLSDILNHQSVGLRMSNDDDFSEDDSEDEDEGYEDEYEDEDEGYEDEGYSEDEEDHQSEERPESDQNEAAAHRDDEYEWYERVQLDGNRAYLSELKEAFTARQLATGSGSFDDVAMWIAGRLDEEVIIGAASELRLNLRNKSLEEIVAEIMVQEGYGPESDEDFSDDDA